MRGDEGAFSIRVLPATIVGMDGQRLGAIRIGSFAERFSLYPFLETVEAIELRWTKQLRLLVNGAEAVGLPTASNMAWILYRLGSEVRVHQMLIIEGVTRPRLSRLGKVTRIGKYSGGRVSEWTTSVEAVREFLAS